MKAIKHLVPVVTLAVAAGFAYTTPVYAEDSAKLAQESRMAMKALGKQLKGRLQAAMKDGGPIKAIGTCNTVAMPISAKVSAAKGMDVARTSLKLRNSKNAPDAWEQGVLEQFEARKAKGEEVMKMEHFEMVENDGKKQFRYMKPIPTGKVCIVCHGSNIAPEIKAKLDELYPNDEARGFAAGDIRGAFTITRDM